MLISHRRMFAGVVVAALSAVALAVVSLAGPLDPPTGPVAPTGKTLDEVFAAASSTGAPSSDFAAPSREVIVMTATSAADGDIEGEDTLFGMPNVIRVHRVEHLVEQVIDPSTGLPTGQRKHGRFRFFKIVDRSTPLLYKAWGRSDTLTQVRFQFYRIDPATSAPEHYYTILLENAKVVDVRLHARETGADSLTHEEEVAVLYQSIIWRHEIAGTEHQESVGIAPS